MYNSDENLTGKRVIGVLLIMPLLILGGVRFYKSWVKFEQNVSGHLKRAADANTVELAIQELKTAVEYLEAHQITSPPRTAHLLRRPGLLFLSPFPPRLFLPHNPGFPLSRE